MAIFKIFVLSFIAVTSTSSTKILLQRQDNIFKDDKPVSTKYVNYGFDESFNVFENISRFLDLFYTGVVSVGTPPEPFDVTFDLNYFGTWIASENCTLGCERKAGYDRKKSTTFTDPLLTGKFTARHAGTVDTGLFSNDVIKFDTVAVKNITFGEVTAISNIIPGSGFNELPYDGVIGLGYRRLSARNTPATLLETMVTDDLLSKCGYSFYYDTGNTSDIVLEIGVEEVTACKCGLIYVNNIPNSHNMWKIKVDYIDVQNGSTKVCAQGGCEMFIQINSAFISGPPAEIEAINSQIGAVRSHGYYLVDCNIGDTMKNISIGIKTLPFNFQPYDYVLNIRFGNGEQMCVSAFRESPDGIWSLGMSFIGLNTHFDCDRMRVGFALDFMD